MLTLRALNLKKSFRQGASSVQVLNGITTTFFNNTTYAITGPSGSGKSTLLHLLAGLDTPTSGNVFLNDHDIATFKPDQQRIYVNKSLGLVFQLPYLIPELSVLENVLLKSMIEGTAQQDVHDFAWTLLHKIGLEHKAHHNPLSLSGGEQQRIAIARAIINKPAFLLADEPTGNLDVTTGNRIIELLLACHHEWHMGIIVSSHDAYVAQRMNAILQLNNGILL